MEKLEHLRDKLRIHLDLTGALLLCEFYEESLMDIFQAALEGPEAVKAASDRLGERMKKFLEELPEILELEANLVASDLSDNC